MRIERQFDAEKLNAIVNDAAVYPAFAGYVDGPIDLTALAIDPANFLLVGEQAALFFVLLQPGLYEVHSQCLPEGRGSWMLEFTHGCLKRFFCETDAVELLTRCPKGNVAARALAKRVGMELDFTNPKGWVKDREPIPADIFSLTIQDWMRGAPDLVSRGTWFRKRLEHEARKKLDEPGESYDRFVGAALEMVFGGQPDKGVVFWNRWAFLSDHNPVSIVVREPLTIDIGDALLVIKDEDFWIASGLDKAA